MKVASGTYNAVRRRPGARPAHDRHVLLGGAPQARSTDFEARLTRRELADRLLATIRNSSGPIVLVVPGTNPTSAWGNANMLTIRGMLKRRRKGPMVVVSVPYNSTVGAAITRFVGINKSNGVETLTYLLEGIRAMGTRRPVYLVGESQGSWIAATTLRERPDLATVLTRMVMFSKPGFVPGVTEALRRIGVLRQKAAPARAGTLPAVDARVGAAASGRVLEVRHTDDIVTGLFNRLTAESVTTLVDSLKGLAAGNGFDYDPHNYEPDAGAAGAFLLSGRRPRRPVHSSDIHQ